MSEDIKSLVQESILQVMFGFRSTIMKNFRALSASITPMHVMSLRIINKNTDCTSQHIADFLKRDKAQIARLIKELISQGLIVSHACPTDKRSRLLELTPAGQSVMQELQLAEKAAVNQMIKGLTEQELQQFLQVTSKMGENLGSVDLS